MVRSNCNLKGGIGWTGAGGWLGSRKQDGKEGEQGGKDG